VPQRAGDPPIAIAHLLSHTAGVVAGMDDTPEAVFQVWSLRDTPATSAPGTRFHYSNLGYKVLGLVLEAVAGEPYPDLLRRRILDPLGMAGTEAAITHAIRDRLAVGYEYLHDDRVGHPGAPLAPATWLQTDTADGSIASTAGDMCGFVRLLVRGGLGPAGRLVSEDAFARMATAQARFDDDIAYGYGLMIRAVDGRTFVGHGGGMVGYLAGVQVDVEAGIGAAVLQNGPAANPMALARTVVAIARDGREAAGAPPGAGSVVASETQVRGEPGAADHAPPPGLYRPDDGAGSAFAIAGTMLRVDGREVELEAWDDDLWLAPDPALDGFLLRVERPPDGAPEIWHGGRRHVAAGPRARTLPEPTDELRAAAGRYRAHNPWAPAFAVVLRGDRAWLVFAAAPDGFEDEGILVATGDSAFRVGQDPGNPETLRFDTVVEGRALRAWLSGWPYYRVG
jgi:hypothetical protein